MRKIFTLLIVAVLFLFVGLPSAIADITTVVSATSTTCGKIDVAVTVTGFTDVGTASLKLNYDDSKLVYTGVDTEISGAQTNANAGVFTLGYYGSKVTISDGTALFTLHFDVLASATEPTDFTWSSVAEDCEYAGLNGTPVISGTFTDLSGYTIEDRPVKNLNTGWQYCTIQAAIDAASANDVIAVSDGTYNETVDVHVAGLNIKSVNGAGSTTISGGGGIGLEGATVRFSADGITIDGFTIDNNTFACSGAGRAVGPMSSDGSTIKNNIFKNTYRGVAGDWYGTPTNLTITGNTFDGANGVCYGILQTEGIDGLIITDNTFANLPKKGVSLGVGVANLTLTGNSFSSNGTTARYIGNYEPALTFDVLTVMAVNTFDRAAGVEEVEGSLIQGIYPTISLAVENAFAGTTIHVIDGVYDEQVVIDGKNLTLEGISTGTVIQPSSPAVLTETYTYPAGTLWPGTVMSAIVLVKNVTGDVTVKNIKVDGVNVISVPTGASRIAGILYGEAGGVIDNATVSDIKTTNYIDRTYGIDVSAVAGGLTVEVKNCNISDWARTGIQAMGAGLTANIHDNILVGPGTIGPNNVPNGIFFLTGVGGNATNNTVSNCHYTTTEWGSTGIGVYDQVAAGISIKDNDISDIDVGVAISLNSSYVVIESNDLYNNHNGVQFEAGANNNSVLGNTITNNSASGIDISSDAGADNIAHNNIITGNLAGVTNESSILFDATCNWYGTADYNQIFTQIVGLVDFVPYLITNDIGNPSCDGEVPPVKNLTRNLYYYSIQEAIDDGTTVDGDVIEVQVADFTEPGFVTVTKSLTIQGQGKTATVVRCNVNTTTAGHGVDAAIWISGSAGKTITIKDMKLDATGKDVKYAVVLRSSGEIENVAFNKIKHSASSPYLGIAVQVLDGNVDINGCTFTEIGRIGVHYRNGVIASATISGTYDNNTYTGKGDGDWLDYALDISGGTTVTVSNSTVTNNTGVALSDGSTSAGVMATTYFPYGLNVPNAVTITGNTLTENTVGIAVGYDENDVSVVTVRNNKIYGNTDYGIESTGPVVDAIENWWGYESGPLNDPKNLCGDGNEVSANVDFIQWWDSDVMDNLFILSIPQESGGPVSTSATVECAADAIAPTLPVVEDYCGTVLVPATPVISAGIVCEGTITYTYTYTDAFGQDLVWIFTYTIDHSTVPVVPADGGSTVECLSDAVEPQIRQIDQQQTNFFSPWRMGLNTGVGQSFTPAINGKLTEIDVNVYSFTGTPIFNLEVYEGDGKTGTPIYSINNYSISNVGWVSLELPIVSAPTLILGVQYTFWLTAYPYNSVEISLGHDDYAAGASWDECTTCSPVIVPTSYTDYDCMFKTYMNTTSIVTPLVTDVCDNSITPVLVSTVDNPSSVPCAGTRTYNYTYTDCAGLVTPWQYVYTIEHSTPPAEVEGPVANLANIECASDAVEPTTLPEVKDVCGNILVPAEAVIETNLTNCEGTIVYKYVYTDCSNLTFEWSFTYNVDDVTPPTITCPADITVNMNTGCTATGVVLSDPTVDDICTAEGDLTVINNTPTVFNEGPTIVTWTVTDCAGNEATCEQTVTVVSNTLSGTVMYNNSTQSPMQEVTLELTPGNVQFITGDDGRYSFSGLCADTYTIEVVGNANVVGGINSTDAGAVNYWGTSGLAIEYVKFLAGDVTNDLYLNSTDAMKIQRYFVFAEPFTRAPWSYWSKGVTISPTSTNHPTAITVDVSGADVADFDIYAMCTGDFNGSLTTERLKSVNMELSLITESNLQKDINQEFELPLRATSTMEVGAVSMILSIPTNLIEVQGVKINGSNIDATWSVKGDELRIGWNSVTPVYVYENESLVTLNLKTKDEFTFGKSLDINLIHNSLNELADANFNVINGATLKAAKIGNGVVGVNEELDSNELTFSNYPNPFANHTTLQYSIPEEGKVSINIYNQLGQLVNSLVEGNRLAGQHSIPNCGNGLQPGIYIAKLRLTNQNLDIEGIIKLNVVK